MDIYTKNYKGLNKAQKTAVDTLDGPVLVIAGPGTGKTQLLSMRVANIMKKTDTNARNILCLTFTNKAAINMRDRLFDLAGPATRDVQVRTFHSFAAELINQYPEYFWKGARLQLAPEATQTKLIEDILFELEPDNPLATKFGGKFTARSDVINAIQLAKEGGLTPEKLSAICEMNLAYIDEIEEQFAQILSPALKYSAINDLYKKVEQLPNHANEEQITPFTSLKRAILNELEEAMEKDNGTNKTKNVGSWKAKFLQNENGKKGMHKERQKNTWWIALSDVYKKYRDNMHAKGHYDYADMLVEVLSQLDKCPQLLNEVQEHYQYVLIDEFQDSNAAQLRLSYLVANDASGSGRPNIMAVGDDDQSIFGFNGAELGTMLFFEKTFTDPTIVVLTDNYRSSQQILDTSEKVISFAEERLVDYHPNLRKKLKAKKSPEKIGQIEHRIYKTQDHQLSLISRNILKNYQRSESIAVLAAKHESLERIASLLLGLGVPIRYERQNNILKYEAVQQIILLSKIVHAIKLGDKNNVNAHLANSLAHPMWGIQPEQLWKLAISNRQNPDWLESLKTDHNTSKIASWLHWLTSTSRNHPLPLIIEFLIGLREGSFMLSPVRNYFTSSSELSADYLKSLSGIRLLRELVNEFADGNIVNLKNFIDFIDTISTSSKGISDSSLFVTGENAVNLYSVHKAKGLEFDRVYIIDCIEKYWQPKGRRRIPPANLPLENSLDHPDDYIRLMYVAMTRARKDLIISSYQENTKGEEVLPPAMIRSALPSKQLDNEKIKDITILEENLTWPKLDISEEKHLLQGYVENFSINVTNLLNFLDLENGGPEYFKRKNLLKLPEAKSTSQSLGSALHSTLDKAQLDVNNDKFDITSCYKYLKKALDSEHLTPEDNKSIYGQGSLILTTIFKTYGYTLPKGSASEQRISGIKLTDAIIDGTLDRVDKNDEKLVIVDYKTGAALNNFGSTAVSSQTRIWKHKTQLIFYVLLASLHSGLSFYKDVTGQMVYLQAKTKKQLTLDYRPTDDEIKRLEKLIEAVHKKIRNLDFPDVSKYEKSSRGITQFEDDLIAGKI